MTENEKNLLVALIQMVKQYLEEKGGVVYSNSMSAGEHAIEALVDFGLMESSNPASGRWTKAGHEFIEDDLYPIYYPPSRTPN